MLKKLLTSIAITAALIVPAHANGWEWNVMNATSEKKVHVQSTYIGNSELMVGCEEDSPKLSVFWAAEYPDKPEDMWNVLEIWGADGVTQYLATYVTHHNGFLLTAFTNVDAVRTVAGGGAIGIALNMRENRLFQRFTVDGPADIEGLLDKCRIDLNR